MESGKPEYDINELAAKWQQGNITPEEKAFYEAWYAGFDDTQTIIKDTSQDTRRQMEKQIYLRLRNHVPGKKSKHIFLFVRAAAAIAVLVTISIAGYYFLHARQAATQVAKIQEVNIVPGGNKAVLTLGDGRSINLTDANSGTIANQGNAVISKTKDGRVVYNPSSQPVQNETVSYNTITVPKGGQYAIVLPDGSRVILNAASSLRFPTAFSNKNRTVQLDGEAYFEVVHNSRQPFQVISKGQLVEDIGTQFNINAYNDEPGVKTTLLEGSVKVSLGKQAIIMKPGQQALAGTAAIQLEKYADPEAAIAWKNGNFQFDNSDIYEIMRQVARWYNVDVQYQGNFDGQQFSGVISRYANVSDVLNIMQSTGAIHFKIKERRIIVMP